MNDALDGKLQEFAWGSIAESALGHTSSDLPRGYKEFGLRKDRFMIAGYRAREENGAATEPE
jgi:hypothetical protein